VRVLWCIKNWMIMNHVECAHHLFFVDSKGEKEKIAALLINRRSDPVLVLIIYYLYRLTRWKTIDNVSL